MLIVVKDGDGQLFLEAFLDLVAARGGDVFEVDGAKVGGDGQDGVDDLIGVLGVQADGKGVDASKALKEHRLAFHDRQGGQRADIAESQDTAAIGDDCHHLAADGQVKALVGVGSDGLANAGHFGGVDLAEIDSSLDLGGRHDGDLAAQVLEKDDVGDVDDLYISELFELLDDDLAVLGIASGDGKVAQNVVTG